MEKNLISIDVSIDGHTTVTREATEDQWDADDLAHSYHIDGWYITERGPYRIDPEKPVYAVYVNYSTGDSFHRETGLMEVMMVNQNPEMAKRNVEQLEAADKSQSYSVDLFLDDGSTFKQSACFTGYFESLEYAGYEQISAVSKPKSYY
jgi:hypothetical protein